MKSSNLFCRTFKHGEICGLGSVGKYLDGFFQVPRTLSTSSEKPKTAIVMMNMGGPQKTDQVHDYLLKIMTDRDMIQLPMQSRLGPWIAQRRTEEVKKKYEEIGGGSPILKWTKIQGEALCQRLDKVCPETAPHKPYTAFRYVDPMTHTTLEEVERDGAENVVFFSQYPQYSCATSGSSFNAIFDYYKKRSIPPNVKFSVIDRWASHPLLASVFAERIKEKLLKFPEDVRNDVLILYSAHSLPLKAVRRGDNYPAEVAASVHGVVNNLKLQNIHNPYQLVWQSKVGPLPWLEPYTDDAIKAYVRLGRKNLMLVPIAFVNEHIETLHEMDIEYCHDLAKEVGVQQIERASAPNDHPIFIDALTEIVKTHLTTGLKLGNQFTNRCPHCVNNRCHQSKTWFKKVCQ
ncbi:ferrochelatase, mitochondrial [Arctopsyche grandis]|uniref:ferrochelatase, mitochondrial n=1 Tax=Arctopsyche grandis TaxID=121162 RepID=UPI00406D7BFB